MGARLISLFGISDWTPVRYSIDNGIHRNDEPTALMPKALVELTAKQRNDPNATSSIVILGTDEARQNYETAFAIEASTLEDRFRGRYAFDRLHKGDNPEGYREAFERVIAWLRPEAIDEQSLEFREHAAPDEIIVDITHGLRPQALIAGTAMTFVLAEAVRTRAMVPVRVVYGRYDKGDEWGLPDFHAPVWDLSEFVTTTLWTLAIQGVRYGRADAVEILARQEYRSNLRVSQAEGKTGPELASDKFTDTWGIALRKFADALAFLRAKELMQSAAPRLVDLLRGEERLALQKRIPALRALLDELERDASSVAIGKEPILGARGLEAMSEMARLYERIERFAEQAATLREAYVTYFGLHHVTPAGFIEPKEPGARRDREEVERVMNLEVMQFKKSKRPSSDDTESSHTVSRSRGHDAPEPSLLTEIDQAQDVRNNILHLALQEGQGTALNLRERLTQLTGQLADRCKNES